MSQVLETVPSNGATATRAMETFVAPENQQGFDIVKVLWRWKWLPIIGALIGTGLGYLYYTKQPTEYIAHALVQVVDALPPTPIQAYDPKEVANISRADESRVIRSQTVLRMAVERGNLTEQPALRGKTVDQIVGNLMSTKDLVVQPAAKDSNTTLIEISYVSHDADLAAAVVNAIVDGYSDYLTEEYRTVGNEVYDLLNRAEANLNASYEELKKRNDQFKEQAKDILWIGDQASDPYAASYRAVQERLTALKMEKTQLQSYLSQADAAIRAGRPAEQILLLLAAKSESNVVDSLFTNPVRQNADKTLKTAAETESERLERQQLFPLIIREQELLDQFGEAHPALVSVRKRIELLRKQIAMIRDAEQKEAAALAKLQEEVDAENAQNGQPKYSVDTLLRIRIESFKERLAALEIEEQTLTEQAAQDLAKSNELQRVLSEKALIDNQLANVKTLLETFQEKLNALELLPQAGQRTLKELNLPSVGTFYGPKLPPYLLGGAAIGFMILAGLAVLMDLADRSYRSPDEIAADLGMPVLGHVPVIETDKVKKVIESIDPSLTTIHHSRGRVSEAFRQIRTGLFFSNRGADLKVIQVTSPVPGDGKSTLSSNLAVTMAQSGRRVLLIDADFRRPRIAKLFGIEGSVGMAQVVAGKVEIEDATFTSNVANLAIMPGGKRPSNPAELLSSTRFRDLLDMLREKYDIIIVDTPPLLAVSDPGAVAAVVDGVVMTMRLRRNVKPLATRAVRLLESVDARLLGVVVNGVSAEAGYGYSYSYNDYRYAYRYGGNYRYGYRYGYKYGGYSSYSAGYIEDHQEASLDGEEHLDGSSTNRHGQS
ncbi:MAG: capsular polysaccharide biosynthesis protein [Pirellulaceae bacterium]|nr:MAG: capsular polysaccharide biosynthesis protein [Pirellulaceae bacterium]